MANYTITPVFVVRGTNTYSRIQEDGKDKIFNSQSEAQNFINHLETAHAAGVASVKVTKVTDEISF